MLYSNVYKAFKESTGISEDKIEDYRPALCNLANTILVWLKDGTQLIYTANEPPSIDISKVQSAIERCEKLLDGFMFIQANWGELDIDNLKTAPYPFDVSLDDFVYGALGNWLVSLKQALVDKKETMLGK